MLKFKQVDMIRTVGDYRDFIKHLAKTAYIGTQYGDSELEWGYLCALRDIFNKDIFEDVRSLLLDIGNRHHSLDISGKDIDWDEMFEALEEHREVELRMERERREIKERMAKEREEIKQRMAKEYASPNWYTPKS